MAKFIPIKNKIPMSMHKYERLSAAAIHFVTSRGIDNEKATLMVHEHYMPIFSFVDCLHESIQHQRRPLIIGVSAPQGIKCLGIRSHVPT
jgi:pantothenate kinase-related protein Tda10